MTNQNAQISGPIATGRRKNAIARVTVVEGSGKVVVNDRPLVEFFNGLERHQKTALKPLEVFPSAASYDFVVIVNGGGVTGQAGAIRHCLARAIKQMDPAMKANLRKEGLLTRDPRMVERKKSGRPKARKRFQFSKR